MARSGPALRFVPNNSRGCSAVYCYTGHRTTRLVITPIYDDGPTGFSVWSALNWPMIASLVVTLAATECACARQGDAATESPGVKVWLQTNIRFYASLMLTLAFLNNWLADLIRESGDGLGWLFIDGAFAAVMLSIGLQLWRAPPTVVRRPLLVSAVQVPGVP